MTVYEETIAKSRQLPEPLLEEVSNFVGFLLMKQAQIRSQPITSIDKPA